MTAAAPATTVLLDNRSTPCAVGLIRAASAVRTLQVGDVLEIWTRDRVAPVEIPVWVERDGHQIVRQERVGRWPRGHYVFQVRAGPVDPGRTSSTTPTSTTRTS
jgi:TusA-related sulfurtransferase